MAEDDDTKSNTLSLYPSPLGRGEGEGVADEPAAKRTGPPVPKPPARYRPLAGPSIPVVFGAALGGGASVTSVMADGKEYGARENPKVVTGSKIEIYGKNLDVFDEWQIQQTGRNPINLDEPVYEGGYKVIFTISQRLAGRLFEGANFGITLFSGDIGGRRRILPLVFVFQAKAEDKDKEKEKTAEQKAAEQARQASAAGAGAGGGFDLPGMFVQAGGDIMAGAAGGLAAGIRGRKVADKTAQPVKTVEEIAKSTTMGGGGLSGGAAGSSSGGQAGADVDYDTDIESTESVESVAGGGVKTRVDSSVRGVTGTIRAGGETISQGGTVQAGGQQTISAGGTVQSGAQISERGAVTATGAGTISGGGGTVRASGQAPAGGTVSGIDAKAQVSGEVRVPTSAGIKVEGQAQAEGSTQAEVKAELGQKTQVGAEATAGGGISAKTQGTVQAPVQAGGLTTGVSGTAEMTGGTTGARGLNLGGGSTIQAGLEGQAALGKRAEGEEKGLMGQKGVTGEKGETGGEQIRGVKIPPEPMEPSLIEKKPTGLEAPSEAERTEGEEKGLMGQKGVIPTLRSGQAGEKGGEPAAAAPPEVQKEIDALKAREKPLDAIGGVKSPAKPGAKNLGEAVGPAQAGTGPAKEPTEPSAVKSEPGQQPPLAPSALGGPKGEEEEMGPPAKGSEGVQPGAERSAPTTPSAGASTSLLPAGGDKLPGGDGSSLPSKPERETGRKDLRGRKLPTFGTRFGKALAKQKFLGKASGKLWDIAAGTAYGAAFTIVGFYVGLLGMNAYWIAHAREEELFPMAGWKKAVTVFTNILGIGAPLVLVMIIWYTGCNYPGKGRLSVIGSVSLDACQALDSLASAARGGLSGTIPPPQAPPGALCAPAPVGPASASALAGTCFGQNAAAASIIAGAESGGDPGKASRVDICTGDGAAVSWGLFQINLSAHSIGGLDCLKAFSKMYTGSNKDCRVVNQALYQQCVQAATDPAQNIQRACEISGNGSNWQAWALTKNKCGL